MGFLSKFGQALKKNKAKTPPDILRQYLSLVKKEPGNAKAHLKLAELYQKQGEKQKAISEYLLAAEIFAKNNFYARAMAIYKQVPRRDPTLDHVHLKIADIYRKMGFLGDAFAEYRYLVRYYDQLGMKEKALGVMSLMAELDPRKTNLKEKIKGFKHQIKSQSGDGDSSKASAADETMSEKKQASFFDLGAELETDGPAALKDFQGGISTLEKICGFEEIFRELKGNSGPSSVDPHFNYNMGVACREMGFLEDAIEQFQIAYHQGQSPLDAANLLGLCYKDKGMWEEARQAFETAVQVNEISPEKRLEITYELGLLYKEQGKTEEALKLLRQINAVDPGVLKIQEGVAGPKNN